ncbi:hypothetical protein, partial [Escherichia albertii]|uniref:hypothetical protein n=2 Tax=Escherichia albertii TaxID=208962 RepID=UPI000CF745C4
NGEIFMNKMIRIMIALLSLLLAASMLSGAGVEFTHTWYAAPAAFSKFIVTIFTMGAFVTISLKISKKFSD